MNNHTSTTNHSGSLIVHIIVLTPDVISLSTYNLINNSTVFYTMSDGDQMFSSILCWFYALIPVPKLLNVSLTLDGLITPVGVHYRYTPPNQLGFPLAQDWTLWLVNQTMNREQDSIMVVQCFRSHCLFRPRCTASHHGIAMVTKTALISSTTWSPTNRLNTLSATDCPR